MTARVPDRFQILEVLEEGPVQSLLRARDSLLEREVLLKIPGPELTAQFTAPGSKTRVLREARVLASLRHPGVVGLLEVVDAEEGPILVLESIAGERLFERLARAPLSGVEARELCISLCHALQAMHSRGIVHRDLSTAAVLLAEQGAMLVGFGFAKPNHGGHYVSSICYGKEGDRARPTALPAYPSPEQLIGQMADARSDLYGLGCLLYRCVTGKEVADLEEADPQQIEREISTATGGDTKMAKAVRKCLARSPMGRFQTADELQQFLGGAGEQGESTGRSRLPLMLGSGAALAASVLGLFLWQGSTGAEPFVDGGAGERGRRISSTSTASYQANYATTHALLIGIGDAYDGRDYQKLPNAVRDVQVLAEVLTDDLGWPEENLTVLENGNASSQEILRALQAINKDAGPDDRVFVYYAGHADVPEGDDEHGYIIPADARARPSLTRPENSLLFENFNSFMNSCRAKHVLLSFDCCFSGRLDKYAPTRSARSIERGMTRKSRLVLSSTGPDDPAPDGSGEHSPFAKAMIDLLREQAERDYSIHQLFGELQSRIESAQTPSLLQARGDDRGVFMFSLGQAGENR